MTHEEEAVRLRAKNILGQGGLDLELLRRLTQRPAPFAPHEAPFWNDPHISRQMLAAHLDPEWEAASRPHRVVDQEVRWLVSHLRLEPGQKVLDLGCGPGLYCARLHELGLRVTGVDFSAGSIDYARQHAREHGLDVEYVCQDYFTLDRVEEFDAALIIYLDFAVFSDDDRAEFLRRVHRALKPGGAFVLDVPTPSGPVHREGVQSWAVCRSGFWKPGPYLELTQEFQYPEESVDVQQTVVVEESGQVSVYRIWSRLYTVETIAAALEAHGFRVQDVWAGLTGRPYQPDSGTLGVVARKRR